MLFFAAEDGVALFIPSSPPEVVHLSFWFANLPATLIALIALAIFATRKVRSGENLFRAFAFGIIVVSALYTLRYTGFCTLSDNAEQSWWEPSLRFLTFTPLLFIPVLSWMSTLALVAYVPIRLLALKRVRTSPPQASPALPS